MMPTKGLVLADNPRKTRGNSLGRGDPYESTDQSPRVPSTISPSAGPSGRRVLRWLWGATVSFMILAPVTFITGRAWGEPAQPPTDLAAVIQTDSDFMKEELKFLQEETVSIAVTHEQPISEAPSNVYVITDEDIRQSGAIDIPTILRRVPGLEIIQMTGAKFEVSARGNNQPRANKILVLIDGRSVYLDVQGEVRWKTFPISLAEIKRIEILKGPASVLYGFNAFDGVINIITKNPQEINGSIVQVGGGEFGTILSSVIYGGSFKNLGVRLSGGWEQTQQWRDRDSLAFRAYRFNLDTNYKISPDNSLKFSGGFVNNNRFDGPIVENVATRDQLRQGYVNLGYQGPNYFLRGYWTNVDIPSFIGTNPLLAPFIRVTDRDGNSNQSQTWNSYDIEGQYSFEFLKSSRLTLGINYRHNSISSNFISEFSHENRLGVYLQEEWKVSETIQATGGVRLDLHSEINPTYSPRFSLIFRPKPNHTIRASISLAYRPPTLYETNNESIGVFPLFGFSTRLVGSTNLGPEQIISYELGYQGWYLKHRLRLRADLFYNHLSDLIIFARRPDSPPTANPEFFNTGEGDVYGGEAGAEFLILPWLSGFANYSYVQFGQNFIGTARREAPRFKANGGIRLNFDNGLNGEAVLHYVGSATYPLNSLFFLPGVETPDQRVGSYFLLNLRGGYQFWEVQGQKKAEVAVSAFNTLNDRHREHPLGDIISNRVMGWLTVRY